MGLGGGGGGGNGRKVHVLLSKMDAACVGGNADAAVQPRTIAVNEYAGNSPVNVPADGETAMATDPVTGATRSGKPGKF